MSLLRIWPHGPSKSSSESKSLFGHESGVYWQTFKCLSISPFLTMSSQPSFGQDTESSKTKRLIGMFGLRPSKGLILKLQRGQVGVLLMHYSQKRLWQQGVSTASSYISRQIGQSHRSSERPEAAKYVSLLLGWAGSLFPGVLPDFFRDERLEFRPFYDFV